MPVMGPINRPLHCPYARWPTTNSYTHYLLSPCSLNNLRQNPNPSLNLIGLSTTVSKAQVMFPIARIYKEPFTCRHQYTLLQRKTLYFLSKDILRQTEPDEKATRWACPLRIRRHILAQSC